MELKSTINIILKDLEDARDLIDDLRNYPGVPLIQIELARSKCRSAEDVIRLLSSLLEEKMAEASEINSSGDSVSLPLKEQHNRSGAPVEPPPAGDHTLKKESTPGGKEEENRGSPELPGSGGATVGKEPYSSQADGPETKGSAPEDIAATEEKHSDETTESKDDHSVEAPAAKDDHSVEATADKDDHSVEAPADKDDHLFEAPEAEDDHSVKAPAAKLPHSGKESRRIVADRFTHLSERFNEQIGDSKIGGQDSARVKKNITDITKEIGINDRFFLIREMFGGSQEKYITALNELNRVTSNEEAMQVIEKYSSNSGDREAGKMLSELVKRKLSSPHG